MITRDAMVGRRAACDARSSIPDPRAALTLIGDPPAVRPIRPSIPCDGAPATPVGMPRDGGAESAGQQDFDAALCHALERGELSLRHQPIVDVEAGRLHAVEVLLRWHNPRLGAVSPAHFVPRAEALGLIQPITLWMVEQAARELGAVLRRLPDMRVTLNLSATQISPPLIDAIVRAMAPLPPARATIEVTEGILLSAGPEVAEAFAVARAAGLRVALDDFGTGYASIGYLERHPVDLVKVDRRFAPRADETGGRIAAAILAMARELGVETVAEGVETEAQLAFYRAHGCRLIQGYLFAKPMPAADLLGFAKGQVLRALRGGTARPAAAPPVAAPHGRHLPEAYVERLETLLATVSDWLWESDEEHRLTFVSGGVRRAGFPSDYMLGATRWGRLGVTDPASHPVWSTHIADLEARRPYRGFVYALTRPDGAIVHVELAGDPVHDASGRFKGYRGTARDVTARVVAEERLRESEARLEAFLDTAADWAWETDAEHRFRFFSRGAERAGLDVEALIGRTRWEVRGISDPASEPFWAAHLQDLEAHRPFRGLVLEGNGPVGHRYPIEVGGDPVFDAEGRFQGYRGTVRDLTAERARSEAQSLLNEQLWLVGEAAGTGWWHKNLVSGAVTWSETLCAITGRDPAAFEHEGEGWLLAFHPEDRDAIRAAHVATAATGEAYELRVRILRPDGTVRDVVSRGRAQRDAQGRIIGRFGVVQDVTEEMAAQRALLAQSRENELFREMIHALPDMVAAKDESGRYLFANAAQAADLGVDNPAMLIGQSDDAFFPPEIAAEIRHEEAVIVERGDPIRLTVDNPRPNGSQFVLDISKSALRDASGHVRGVVIVNRNATERVLAERALRASEEANRVFRQMIESMPDLVFAKDQDGRFLAANEVMARALGQADASSLIGRAEADLIPQELAARYHAADRALLDGEVQSVTVEEPFRRADGTVRVLSTRKSLLRDAEGRVVGLVGHARDVTEEVAARDELSRSSRENELFREMIHALPDMVAAKDESGRYLFANAARAADVGVEDPDLLTGQTDDAFLDAETAAEVRAEEATVLAGQPIRLTLERRRARGGSGLLEIAKSPLRDAQGHIRGLVIVTRDITEETAARQENMLFRQIVEAIPNDLAVRDTEGRYLFANAHRARLFGAASPEDLVGRTHADFFPPEEAERLRADDRIVIESGVARVIERDIVQPNGDHLVMISTKSPLRDPDGRIMGVLTLNRDVTEQVRAERALSAKSRENEIYRQMFEALPDQIYFKDRDLRFVLANEATARVIGLNGAQGLIGRSDADLFPDGTGRRFMAEERAVLEAGEPVLTEELSPTANGRPVWLNVLKVPVRDETGAVVGFIGHGRDITQQIAAREELARRERENAIYRQMIETLPDYLFAKDQDGRFIAANGATARVMGVESPEALLGSTDHDHYPKDVADRFRADEQAFMALGRTVLIEQPGLRVDRSPGTLLSLKTPLRDSEGRIIGHVGHGRDITDQRTAQDEVDRGRALLEAVVEASPVSFALFGPDGRLRLCNSSFASSLELRAQDIAGCTLEEMLRLPQLVRRRHLDGEAFEAWLKARLAAHRAGTGEVMEVRFGDGWHLVRDQRLPDGSTLLSRTDITPLKRTEEELRRLATIDALTGVANRRHIGDQAARMIARCRQDGAPMALALIDVDHFKQVNDRHGHATGDLALRLLSATLEEHLRRPCDLLGRWGGEEFIVVLPGATPDEAFDIVERLRQAAKALPIPLERGEMRVTISQGLAFLEHPEDTLEELARRADQALYRAKAAGRDRAMAAWRQPCGTTEPAPLPPRSGSPTLPPQGGTSTLPPQGGSATEIEPAGHLPSVQAAGDPGEGDARVGVILPPVLQGRACPAASPCRSACPVTRSIVSPV